MGKTKKSFLSKLKLYPSEPPPAATNSSTRGHHLMSLCNKYPQTRSITDDRNVYYMTNASTEISPRFTDPSPEEIHAASQRFFLSPRASCSLTEEAWLRTVPSVSNDENIGSLIPDGGVAVETLSEDPYKDFLASMQEMVQARIMDNMKSLDWEFMEELLYCYLEVNKRSVHVHIVRAFKDLIYFG